MLSLKEWMELVDYKITEGTDYYAFSPNAYSLNAWSGTQDGYSFDIVFDTKTQVVYQVEACDYRLNRAYRLVHPLYKDQVQAGEKAWDGTKWIDLEVDDDFIQKALAIKDGKDYDTRVQMELDIPEEDLLLYMKEAHKRDMTFNAFIEEALRTMISNFEQDPEGMKARAKVMFGSPNGA